MMGSLGLFLTFVAVVGLPLAGLVMVLLRGVSVRFTLDIAPDASQQAEQTAPTAPSPRKRVQTIAAPRPKSKRSSSVTTDPAQPYTAPHHPDAQHPHALGTWGAETAPHGHSTHTTHNTGNAGGDE